MKKVLKRILIIIAVIGVSYCVLKFLLITFFVFFSNKRGGELRPEEIKLFTELKKELSLKKIERTPEYNISEPKENETYGVYLKYVDCSISKDSLNKLAKKIVLRVDKRIVLSHKFSSIELIFEHWDCTPGDISFHFSKKDIYDLQEVQKRNENKKLD